MNTLSTNLPRSPDSVGAARRLVDGHTASLDFQQQQDAALMVSALVTNAVVHGVGAIWLRIDAEADTVRIEVADDGNVAVAPSPEPGAHGGWGLRIVEQLADDWGVLDGSPKVWFRLGRPRAQRFDDQPSNAASPHAWLRPRPVKPEPGGSLPLHARHSRSKTRPRASDPR